METSADRITRGNRPRGTARTLSGRARERLAGRNDQYIEPTGASPLLEILRRAGGPKTPLADVTVAVIGGGFAGLVTGARLKEAGVDDVVLIEGAGRRSAWYGTLSGAMCDTAAMIYLPPKDRHMPTRKYPSPLRSSATPAHRRTFRLYEHALSRPR